MKSATATAPPLPSSNGIVTQSKPLPDRIFLYAPPGWGKTSFCAYFPAPLFITPAAEDGLQTLIANGLLPPTPHLEHPPSSWNEFSLAVQERLVRSEPFQTLVLDTANAAERLAQEETCATHFKDSHGKPNWAEDGFNAYGRGEKISTNELWIPFLTILDELRATKRIRIVLTAHTCIREYANPAGPDYKRIEPSLSKTAWAATCKWADMILYGGFEIYAKKEGTGKYAKAKAVGGTKRIIYAQPHAVYDAKNRHGLPADIPLGDSPQEAWTNSLTAFPKKGT